jgi:hypothetical protein
MPLPDIVSLIEEYIAAWNEPDPSVRLDLLETVWHDEGTYTDPVSHATNRAGLDAVIEGFLGDNPDAKFMIKGRIDHHHDYARFYWTLHLANSEEIPGMDYGEVSPDGKLVKIVRFF